MQNEINPQELLDEINIIHEQCGVCGLQYSIDPPSIHIFKPNAVNKRIRIGFNDYYICKFETYKDTILWLQGYFANKKYNECFFEYKKKTTPLSRVFKPNQVRSKGALTKYDWYTLWECGRSYAREIIYLGKLDDLSFKYLDINTDTIKQKRYCEYGLAPYNTGKYEQYHWLEFIPTKTKV